MSFRRRVLWLVVGSAFAGTLAPVASAGEELPPDESADVVDGDPLEPSGGAAPLSTEELAAIGEAVTAGERVEVESSRDEWDTVFAEPSGELTVESSIAAVRTRVGAPDGQWRDIDTTLEVTADGVAPVAPALPMSFSAGGDTRLATIERDGHELELSWPEVLPDPVVEGSMLKYGDVYPGVDLVVTVDPDGTGFSEVLVVDSPQAAAGLPAELSLGTRVSDGASLAADDGGFVVTDQDGITIFDAPQPVMWDSSGAAPGVAQLPGEIAPLGLEGVEVDPGLGVSAADAAVTRLVQPAEGDMVAEVETVVDATNDRVMLVPDAGMLSDPDTVYPIFIDPSTSGTRHTWTMIQSGSPNSTAGYKFSGDEGLGRCEVALVSSCNVNNTKRLVWEFGGTAPNTTVSRIWGSVVSSATFSAYGVHSWSCTDEKVRAYRVNNVDSSSTWNNRAGWESERWMTSRTVSHKPACDDDRWIEFDMTEAAQHVADTENTSVRVGLRADNESEMDQGWKRYRYDAKLSITYNHPPNKPTGLRTTSPSMSGCNPPESRPWVNDNTPVLRATISDPNGDSVLGRFLWSKHSASGGWSAWTATNSAYGSSGSERSYQMPTLSDGYYRWLVKGYDGTTYGPNSTGPSSNYCYFQIDTTDPAAPTLTIDAPYVFGYWHELDDLPSASVTFDRGSDTSVSEVRYQIDGGSVQSKTMSGSTTSVTITPTYGVTEVTAWLVDGAGNSGPSLTEEIKVMSPRVQHAWTFNDDTGAQTLGDLERPTGQALDLALGSGQWVTGVQADGGVPGGHAVWFDGIGEGATTDGPAVFPMDSFTIGARVKLDEMAPDDSFYAVNLDGSGGYPVFKFGYHPDLGNWRVYWHTEREASGSYQYLDSGVAPRDEFTEDGIECGPPPEFFFECAGDPDWAHLALVYDAPSTTLKFFVDGVLAGEIDHEFTWADDGGLRLGRGQNAGGFNGGATGAVDDVAVFDAALKDQQVDELSHTYLQTSLDVAELRDSLLEVGIAAHWPAGEGSGSTLADTSGGGSTATLQPGASWAPDGPTGGSALSLDGVAGHARTDGPVLDTTSSFTVSAWARLDQKGDWHTVVAQEGEFMSPFRLMYRSNQDAWCFSIRLVDAPGGTLRSACADSPPQVGSWTHLTGVYDAGAGEGRLYVDGELVKAYPVENSWQATGDFLIGRTLDVGGVGTGDHFPGDIADVRAYQRVLSPAEITFLAQEGL